MSDNPKSLLMKAADDLDFVKDRTTDDRHHDNIGLHIAYAVEKSLKALLSAERISYSSEGQSGHSLSSLFDLLETNRVKVANGFEDLIALKIYNSKSRYDYIISASNRLNLTKMHDRAYQLYAAVLRNLNSRGLI